MFNVNPCLYKFPCLLWYNVGDYTEQMKSCHSNFCLFLLNNTFSHFRKVSHFPPGSYKRLASVCLGSSHARRHFYWQKQMAISPTIRFLSTGWHVKHGEHTGGHAVIPRQPQSAPLAGESPGSACSWGIWITGNYFTFGFELFWQSSAVSLISSFLACKRPFYSSYSYRIYSSLFLKLLIPTSSFLFKSVPFHLLGIPRHAKCIYSSGEILCLPQIISRCWPLLSRF